MGAAGFLNTDTDVLARGAPARPSSGTGASLFYRGSIAGVTNPDTIANKFSSLWEYCDNYRKKFIPEMLEAFNQYNGDLDQQSKEAWQSNIFVPLPAQAIDVATGRIVAALFSEEDFFEVAPMRRQDDLLTEFAKRSTLWALSKARGQDQIKAAVKDALICGLGIIKVHYAVEVEDYTDVVQTQSRGISVAGEIFPGIGESRFAAAQRAKKCIRIEAGIPTDFWLDPTGKNRFIIQRTTRFIADLWEGTRELRDPSNGKLLRKAVYDRNQVVRCRPGMHDTQRQIEAARIRRDLATPFGNIDQTVDVYELWGDFPDITTGEILYRNCVATFVDRRFTIRMPQSNPFLHCMSPFVAFTAKLLPHQVYPYGLLYQNRRIEDAINRHANMILDKAMFQVPTLEYDKSACSDPRAFDGDRPSFKPGKMWPRKPGPNAKIFYPVEGFQPVTPFDLSILDRLTNWYATGNQVSEFATGQQLSNNRKTKAEAQIREQASQQNFNDAAVHIESYAITPLLKLIYLTMLQYEDQFDDLDLQRLFSNSTQEQLFLQSVGRMSPAERWAELRLDSEFKAVGVTNEITRQKRLEQITGFVQTLSTDPMLGMFINKREEVEGLRKLYGQPSRILLDNADQIIEQMQMAAMQQQMGAGQGPPPQMGAGQPQQAQAGRQGNPHNALARVNAEAGRNMGGR